MDSRLFMEIGMDGTTFQTVDNSPYERWINDGKLDNNQSHAIVQRLIHITNDDDNELYATDLRIANTVDELRDPWIIENVSNGLYYYQKLLLPTAGHETHADEILWYDEVSGKIKYFDIDTEIITEYTLWEDFDEVYSKMRKVYPDNCFFFDDYTLSIYSLIECYVALEEERINKFLKNHCSGNCSDSYENEYKIDILLAAINVIEDLIEKGEFFEAQRILDSLNTCGNLCKDISNKLKGCGCGTT